jgi:Holliday junction resolvase RusA-like endonuclease
VNYHSLPESRKLRRPSIGHHAAALPDYLHDPEGKALKEQYFYEAKAQWRGPALTADVKLHVRFFFATKRRRDLDNMNKLVLDALTGIVYADACS